MYKGFMMANYIVPPINSSGAFEFDAPYNDNLLNNKEYTVKAIRTLKEMSDNGEQPFENIYQTVNRTEEDYIEDLNNNVPIVALTDTGGNYAYIPANKIKTMPITTGVKYQETILAINLGMLPVTYTLDGVKELVKDDIQANMGILSTVEAIVSSAVHLVSEEEDKTFRLLLESNKTLKEGYATRYRTLSENYNALQTRLKLLEDYIKINLNPNIKNA